MMLIRKTVCEPHVIQDLQSWERCVIRTGAAASVRTMDSALHSPLPMNLAMCKHSMFQLTVSSNAVYLIASA